MFSLGIFNTEHRKLLWGAFLPGAVFSLLLNLAKLARDIGFVDSCDLSLSAYSLGIAHPTGYPLFSLLGRLFMNIIPSAPVLALGMLSVLAGSAAAGLCGLWAARMIPSRALWMRLFAGAMAGILLATSPLFWSQAARVEVYALNLLLGMVALHLALPRGAADANSRPLVFLALLSGLAFCHHLTFATTAFVCLLLIAPRLWRQPRLIPVMLVAFLLGLSLLLFMPLRATTAPMADWLQVTRLDRLMSLLTGGQFRNKMFVLTSLRMNLQLIEIGRVALQQIPFWLWLAAIPGLVLVWSRKSTFISSLLIIFLGLFIALSYSISDIDVYLITALAVGAAFVGVGIAALAAMLLALLRRLGAFVLPRVQAQTAAGILVATLIPLTAFSMLSKNQKSVPDGDGHAAREFATHILGGLPYRAFLQTSDINSSFTLWWLRLVDGVRPDIEHIEPNNRKYTLQQTAEKALSAVNAGRKVYVDYQLGGPSIGSVADRIRSLGSNAGLIMSLSETHQDGIWNEYVWGWILTDYIPRYREDSEALQAILQPLNDRAVDRILLNDYIGALKDIDLAIELAPERWEMRVNRVGALMGLKRMEEAEQELNVVVENMPGLVEAWGKLGLLKMTKGDRNGAREAFEHAYALDDRSYEALLYLTQFDVEANDYAGAIERLKRLCDVYPNDAEAALRLGQVYMMTQNPKEALAPLEKSVRLAPQRIEALMALGECYLALGRMQAAESQFRSIVHLQPNNREARDRLLGIMQQKGARQQ